VEEATTVEQVLHPGTGGEPTDEARRVAMLRRVGAFQRLPPQTLHHVAAALTAAVIAPGEAVVRQGAASGGLHLIESGTMRVEVDAAGGRHTVARLGPGEFFGEISLLTGGPCTATVVAETLAEVWRIDDHELHRVLAVQPDLADAVRRAAEVRQQGLRAQEYAIEHLNLAGMLTGRDQLRIGRGPDNELVLDSALVSSGHAVIGRAGDTYVLEDLGSTNGTYVNGAPIRRAELKDGDQLRIADQLLVFDRRDLAHVIEPRGIRIDGVGLHKRLRSGKDLLADVHLTILPGELVAIVGGSGAGKSTLLDALSGVRPATEGQVLFNGHDLYTHRGRYTHTLGYVPQDDIIHRELPVAVTLDYAARLRLPSDTTARERRAAVDQAIDVLGLVQQRDIPVERLSGGQRKRSSIAVELLTEPRVFFLDEPTSGLDPAADTSMMKLLRRLAEEGSTVVLTTHATKNVALCDEVVVLARGGHVAFAGAPERALVHFGVSEFDEIYDLLDRGTPESWAARFAGTDDHRSAHAGRQSFVAAASEGDAPSTPARHRRGVRRAVREYAVLSVRNVHTYLRSPSTLVPMLVQPLIMAMLMVALFNAGIFDLGSGRPPEAATMLFTFAFLSFTFGLLYGIQVIAREFGVFHRERLVGQGVVPYVLSKLTFLLPLLILSVAAMLLLLRLTDRLPSRGLLPLFVTIVLVTFAGVALALFTSAAAPTPSAATDLLSLWILPQVLFAGAIATVASMNEVARFISRLTVLRPAFEAAGDATDIMAVFRTTGGPTGQSMLLQYDGFFTAYTTNWAIMAVFVIVPLALTCLVLVRRTRVR
jgi:ABC transport system ATP-binding/permease protein